MKVIILGCGFSLGCPVIACKCAVCTSTEKYNKRSRSAILIQDNNLNILVDFGPEIRSQLISHNIDRLDAIICTHTHADHTAGIDDLRAYGYNQKAPVPLYSDSKTLKYLEQKHDYLFTEKYGQGPFLKPYYIHEYEKINISGIEFQFFDQIHGPERSLGIRIGNFVYANDVTEFPIKSEQYLHHIEHWVLDCVDYEATFAHAGLRECLEWKEKYKPQKIILTNLGHNLDYYRLKKELPEGIEPAYDGYEINTINFK